MKPSQMLGGMDAARDHFAALVDKQPAAIYRHAAQLAWLFAQADRHQMPAPMFVQTANADYEHVPNLRLSFTSLADLTAWALWAEATVEELSVAGIAIGHGFDGAINEVRVSCSYYPEEVSS